MKKKRYNQFTLSLTEWSLLVVCRFPAITAVGQLTI